MTDAPAPLDQTEFSALRDSHGRLAAMCRLLESIADELPRVSEARCAQAIRQLATLLPAHHAAEEALFAHMLRDGRDASLFGRIVSQHHEDEGLAQEIAQALEPLCGGGTAPEPHLLGYMLRCFFNGYRRAMLIEELVVAAKSRPG